VELSVVIPCLNEARSIGPCVEQARAVLESAGIVGEVIVADNGSSDGSPEIAELAGARVVRVARRGYGSAIRGGVEDAHSEFVFIADGDGQHDFADIPRFVDKLRAGNELVVGNRFAGDVDRRSMAWSHRYIGNPLLSGLLRLLFHPQVHDAQSGMRALTRTAFFAMDLRTSGFEFSPEMVVKAAHHHLRMAEIPITVRPDQRDRKPHLRTIPDGWRHLVFILMCSLNYLFVFPGLVLLVLGSFLVTWLAIGPQYVGPIGLDTRAQLFGVMMASFGVQLASIGVFARVFSYSEPLRTNKRSSSKFFSALTLEEGLFTGGVLVVIGLVGNASYLVPWVAHGLLVLQGARWVIFWSFWIVIGLQVCVSSVFLSMIGISRGIWMGRTPMRRAADEAPIRPPPEPAKKSPV
jgi:glycosyltransferase involved in cell wall biosynthesis